MEMYVEGPDGITGTTEVQGLTRGPPAGLPAGISNREVSAKEALERADRGERPSDILRLIQRNWITASCAGGSRSSERRGCRWNAKNAGTTNLQNLRSIQSWKVMADGDTGNTTVCITYPTKSNLPYPGLSR